MGAALYQRSSVVRGGDLVRRSKIAWAAGLLLAVAATPSAAQPTGQVPLTVSATRATTLVTWVPKHVKGVILFSTGHGSWPERYDAVVSAWQKAGFAVIAPVHVDSMHYPDREKFSREASFGERIADLRAASAYGAKTWPGRPVVAAGHSFGTLTALCLGGGLASLGNFRDPSVKAVLGFSSPGRIPGLIGPDAYADDRVPMLLVTGDRDLVPGLVTDWHDHLLPVQSAPAGDKFGVVYAGADHEFIGRPDDANFISAAAISTDFLRAYGLSDAKARGRLMKISDTAMTTWTRR